MHMKNSTRMLLLIAVLVYCTSSLSSTASAAPVVLVTGFGPFQNYSVNPSGLIAEALNGSSVAGAMVVGVVLPVDYNESVNITVHALQRYQPVLVISCGLNPRARTIHVEQIGLNFRRYDKGNGRLSFPRRIDPTGPLFRSSTLPVRDVVRAIRRGNIPVQRSFFPGMYVCNNLFYEELKYTYGMNHTVAVGFLHVPLLSSQDPKGMPLGVMVNATKLAIQTSLPSFAPSSIDG